MNELTEQYKEEFKDKETRHIYADDFLNTYIATQIKVLREEAGLTQAELAEKAGMKQERISVLEDVNYSSWTANVLKRLAKAFDMRLSIKIESFGSYLKEFEGFNRAALIRPPFEEDPAFSDEELEQEGEEEAADVAARGNVIDAEHLFPGSLQNTVAELHYLPYMYPVGLSSPNKSGTKEGRVTLSTATTTHTLPIDQSITRKVAGER